MASFQVLDNLATIHAHSLLHDQWLSNLDMKSTFAKFQKASGDNFKLMVVGTMDMLKNDHAALFDPLIDRLRDICEKGLELEKVDTIHEQLKMPPVLTHGDLWMNNMMWKKTKDGNSTTDDLATIVDWQVHSNLFLLSRQICPLRLSCN
jgi:thiamine kinase-like enzyme